MEFGIGRKKMSDNITRKVAEWSMKMAYDASNIVTTMVASGAKPSEDVYGETQDLLDKRKEKSYGLRHPYITGIPTLGIWPAISRASAEGDIITRIMVRHPEIADQIREFDDKRYNQSVIDRQLRTDNDKANAARNTVAATALPIAYYMASRNRDNRD